MNLDRWPFADGFGGARIEEEIVASADGAHVVTRFATKSLIAAGRWRFTVGSFLSTLRDCQSHDDSPGGALA